MMMEGGRKPRAEADAAPGGHEVSDRRLRVLSPGLGDVSTAMVKGKTGKAAISLFVGDRNVLGTCRNQRREVAHPYNWKYSTFAPWRISARGGARHGWRMGYSLQAEKRWARWRREGSSEF